MHLDLALFLLVVALTPRVSAFGDMDVITLPQRQASPKAAASTTLTSAMSTPDELSEPFSFCLDGKIIPPVIDVGGVTTPKDISISSVDCFIDGEIGLSVGGSWPGDHVQIPLDAEKIPRASTSHTVSTLV